MKLAFSALVLWLAACAAAKRPFLTARQPVVVDGEWPWRFGETWMQCSIPRNQLRADDACSGSGQPALDALSSFQSQVAALATSLDQRESEPSSPRSPSQLLHNLALQIH